MNRILDVYLLGQLAGKLHFDREGKLNFTYLEGYLQRADAKPLSIAMPLQETSYKDAIVRPFFSGLLPDEDMRVRLARCLHVSAENPFALLDAVGGECAGAIMLLKEGQLPPQASNTNETELLSENRVVEIINSLKTRPLLADGKDIRLSLGGAQNKLPVCLIHDQLALAKNNLPTTHILKPPIAHVENSVQNELFCMSLAAKVGLPVAPVEFRVSQDICFLLVTRYDREKNSAEQILRLHQEDFCQALGIPPELKYESEGGPSLSRCFLLIRQYSSQPAIDLLNMLRITIFNYLIGNGDAHGKNFSLLYQNNGIQLAPFYDLMSTLIYNFTPKMAMKLGGYYPFENIYLRHWDRLAEEVGISPKFVQETLVDMKTKVLRESEKLKEALNHGLTASIIYDQIVNVIYQQTEHLKN